MNKREISIHKLSFLVDEFDRFEKFMNDLKSFVSGRDINKIIDKLIDLSNNKLMLGNKDIKEFYYANKDVIHMISHEIGILYFFSNVFDEQGNIIENSIIYYYHYLLKNKESFEKIEELVNEFKRLGITDVILDKNLKPESDVYTIDSRINYNTKKIAYFDNIKILINNYYYDSIKYTTTSSDYVLYIQPSFNGISKYSIEIHVNSLMFDPKSLPSEISKEATFDHIVALKKEQNEVIDSFKNLICLNVTLEDADGIFKKIDELVSKLDGNEKIINALNQLKNDLTSLEDEYEKYKEDILKANDDLTCESLKEQTESYKRYLRNLSRLSSEDLYY